MHQNNPFLHPAYFRSSYFFLTFGIHKLQIANKVSLDLRCACFLQIRFMLLFFRYFNSRVFVSLANGQIVIFQRHFSSSRKSPGSVSTLFPNGAVTSSNLNETDSSGTAVIHSSELQHDPRLGTWDFTEACVITCGQSRTPVRRTIVVPITSTIWTTYRNQILVINALTLQLVNW